MAISLNNRKNKFLALFLALMMASSTAALAACKDEPEDSSTGDDTTTETPVIETDTSRINNGSFEFVNWNDGKNLIITSPTGWSRSTNSASSGTAVSSKSASGIINTDETAWKNLTESALDGKAPTTEAEASALWGSMNAYDKLKFYKTWDDGNHDKDADELDFYNAATDKFNIDIDDVPVGIENPGTHDDSDDTNVLMIHNAYTNGVGTAQKYTSGSTITLQAGTSAHVSLWVKTSNLTFNGGSEAILERGAYIGVTHTVGGKTLDQMQIKNINTELMENTKNGWVEYDLYLQGCAFSSSTFSIVLGLGQSGGTDRFEYVEGYAFFDDVECEIISNEAYAANVSASTPEVTLDTDAEGKIFRADKAYRNVHTYALNLSSGDAEFAPFALPDMVPSLTEEKKNGISYVAADDGKLTETRKVYGSLNFDLNSDFSAVDTLNGITATAGTLNNKYVSSALTDLTEKYPFDKANTKMLMILSADGANYTAKLENAAFKLDAGERMALSFFVKTSDMLGVTGAGVTVRYGSNASAISSIDTTGITTVDVDGENGEDIYGGWQQCFIFVQNDTEANGLTFSLEFNYGPTSIWGASKDNFIEGWAAFANFQIVTDMKDAFDYASAGTYSKIVSLVDPDEESYSSSVFDSPAHVTGTENIKTGIADLRNYTGVVGGSGYVSNDPEADRSKNSNKYAGLISKEYIQAYADEAAKTGADDYWLNKLNLDKAGLEALMGNATQPLLIYNNEESAYGFIANSPSTISSYSAISVRVKVSAGAVAYVYLADMDDENKATSLSIGRRISYWYDAEGNVCSVDPTSEDFNKKKDTALILQPNGLYKVKSGWSGASSADANAYYANLQAYPEYGNGNLMVADGGNSYNYNSYWNNDGVDGIAFYFANGKYYADSAKTIEVKDFSTISKLPARYTAENAHDLSVKVEPTNGEWKTITFYVGAGSQEKNYRLEVWSGSRDNTTKSAAGSYVLFDTNNAGNLDATSYTTLTQEAFDYLLTLKDNNGDFLYADEDALKEAYKTAGKLMYNTYSFYDDSKFLRYDSTIDENGVGNSYDDYDSTSSSYTETIAYLEYENAETNSITIFANYTQNDVTVPVDAAEDDSTNDTTTEEETEGDTNWALLISSLVVAGALILVLAILGVRKLMKWSKKAKAAPAKPVKKVKAKKEKPAKEEPADENSPYND